MCVCVCVSVRRGLHYRQMTNLLVTKEQLYCQEIKLKEHQNATGLAKLNIPLKFGLVKELVNPQYTKQHNLHKWNYVLMEWSYMLLCRRALDG